MVGTVNGGEIEFLDLMAKKPIIPDHQREYDWGAKSDGRKTIAKLTSDLVKHTNLYPGIPTKHYFLGSIMILDKGGWNVSDGQQRITTLYFIAAALRDKMLEKGMYSDAHEVTKGLLLDFLSGSLLLKQHVSGAVLGIDQAVKWASKPSKHTVFSRKHSIINGAGELVLTNACNIPWRECEVWNRDTNTKLGVVTGDPSVTASTFTASPPGSLPTTPAFKVELIASGKKEWGPDSKVKTDNGNTDWKYWKSLDNPGFQGFNKAKREINRLCPKSTSKPIWVAALKHFHITLQNVKFTTSTFDDREHANNYFAIFNDQDTSVPLASGDLLNSWMWTKIKATNSSYIVGTDRQKPHIETTWKEVCETLERSTNPAMLSSFLHHYCQATVSKVSVKKTWAMFNGKYCEDVMQKVAGEKKKRINGDRLIDMVRELRDAAKFYSKIVGKAATDRIGTRYLLLSKTTFAQYPPIMLGFKIGEDKSGAQVILESRLLGALETLFFRGNILQRESGGDAVRGNEWFDNIPKWSKKLSDSANAGDLINSVNHVIAGIKVLLNTASRNAMFTDAKHRRLALDLGDGKVKSADAKVILNRIGAWKKGNCDARPANKMSFRQRFNSSGAEDDPELEHILPKELTVAWVGWTDPDHVKWLHRLGNLAVIPKHENIVLSNGDPDFKFKTGVDGVGVDCHYNQIKANNLDDAVLEDAIDRFTVSADEWKVTDVESRSNDFGDIITKAFDYPVLERPDRWN
jgi:hypothetical protein